MPAYELFLIIKNLDRPTLVKSIKRGAELIIKRDGLIRSFENLGHKKLPYRIKAHDAQHTSGNYLLIKFDMPSNKIQSVTSELLKDQDYIRTGISPLLEYDQDYKQVCACAERGEFVKNAFDFTRPMTSWDKKRVFKNYALRL